MFRLGEAGLGLWVTDSKGSGDSGLYRVHREGAHLRVKQLEADQLCATARRRGWINTEQSTLDAGRSDFIELLADSDSSSSGRYSTADQRPPTDRFYAFASEDTPGRYRLALRDDLVVELETTEPDIYEASSLWITTKISIFRSGEVTPRMVLEAQTTETPPAGLPGLTAADYDGDGYRDLEVLDWWGATGNEGYRVFLYDPEAELFTLSTLYDGGGEPDGSGCVHTHSNGGHAGMIFSASYACPRDGRLAPVSTFSQTYDKESDAYVFDKRTWSPAGRLLSHTEGRLGRRASGVVDTVWSKTREWDPEGQNYTCSTRQWNGTTLEITERTQGCPPRAP